MERVRFAFELVDQKTHGLRTDKTNHGMNNALSHHHLHSVYAFSYAARTRLDLTCGPSHPFLTFQYFLEPVLLFMRISHCFTITLSAVSLRREQLIVSTKRARCE